MTIIKIHASAPDKPEYGAPCNGCGVCCLVAPCPVSRTLLKHRSGACPAVTWVEESVQYRCGMLIAPARYIFWLPEILEQPFSWIIKRWIGLNIGCDANLDLEEDSNE